MDVHLHSLYLSGFKSVSTQTPLYLELCKGVNVVSGANGAGKSNVVDAILFGLTAPEKDLRVSKMRSLIHCKGAVVDKCATVELGFSVKGEKTMLTAKVFNDSDERRFKIQGRTQTITEVRHWAGTTLGINILSPSFAVLQNSVVSFLLKSPKELASILTTATGTSFLRTELASFKSFYSNVWQSTRSSFTAELSLLESKRNTVSERVGNLRRTMEVAKTLHQIEHVIAKQTTAKLYQSVQRAETNIISARKNLVTATENHIRIQAILADGNALYKKTNQNYKQHTNTVMAPIIAAITQLKEQLADISDNVEFTEATLHRVENLSKATKTTLGEKAALLDVEQSKLRTLQDKVGILTAKGTPPLHEIQANLDSATALFDKSRGATAVIKDNVVKRQKTLLQKEGKTAVLRTVPNLEKELQKVTEQKTSLSNVLYTVQGQAAKVAAQLAAYQRTHPRVGLGILLDHVKLKQTSAEWLHALNTCGGKWGVEVCSDVAQVSTLLDVAKQKRKHVRVWCLSQLPDGSISLDRLAKARSLGAVLPSSLLDYPPPFHRAVEKLFPNTVFCKTTAQVKPILSLGLSAVTQDGTVHHAGGTKVTGGYIDTSTNPLTLAESRERIAAQEADTARDLKNVQKLFEEAKNDLFMRKTADVEEARAKAALEDEEENLREAKQREAENLRTVKYLEMQQQTAKGAGCEEDLDEVRARIAQHEQNLIELRAVASVLRNNSEADEANVQKAKEEVLNLSEQKHTLDEQLRSEEERFRSADAAGKLLQEQLTQLKKDLETSHKDLDTATATKNDLQSTEATLCEEMAADEKELHNITDTALKAEAIAEYGDMEPSVLNDMLMESKKQRTQLMGEREALMTCSSVDDVDTEGLIQTLEELGTVVTKKRHEITQATRWVESLWQAANDATLEAKNASEDEKALQSCNNAFKQNLERTLGFKDVELRVAQPGAPVDAGLEVWVGGAQLSLFSGGQKTIIALSFLLAVSAYHAAPFYLLDEVDAALDESNQTMIASLVTSALSDRQVVCITHHPAFRRKAQKILHLQNRGEGTVLIRTSIVPQGGASDAKKPRAG